MKMYKVKVTKIFLEQMSDGKLPVVLPDRSVKLIGAGEEAITSDLTGVINDSRYEYKEVSEGSKLEKTKIRTIEGEK